MTKTLINTHQIKVLFILLLLGIAAFYFYGNVMAPVQRDGGHFLFMANNIAHGQPPYWASFETKNPLVQLYWSPFIKLFSDSLSIAGAARLGEALWMWATAVLVFLGASYPFKVPKDQTKTQIFQNLIIPAILAILYIAVALDFRATDDGFNISLYQSLPELILLFLLLKNPSEKPFLQGVWMGVFVFLAWFVKQTSLLTAGGLVLSAAFVYRNKISWKWVGGGTLSAGACFSIFYTHLVLTHTWDNYFLGTHLYKAALIPEKLPLLFNNLYQTYIEAPQSFDLLNFTSGSFLGTHRVWTCFLTIILMIWGTQKLILKRKEGWTDKRRLLLLAIVWMVLSLLQAIASLMFFNHYFLASLAPVGLVIALFLRSLPWGITLPITALLAWCDFCLIESYIGMHDRNKERREHSYIVIAEQEILPFLRPEDRIFNWSGFPQLLVASGRPSDFSLNMHWPFITEALPREERQKMLKNTLSNPPDVVLVIDESYTGQKLTGELMTSEKLNEITGLRYELLLTVPGRGDRADNPVKVFRRFDS